MRNCSYRGPRGFRSEAGNPRTGRSPQKVVAPRPPSPPLPTSLLPQGEGGNDVLTAIGDRNFLNVCPASALPTDPDLVFFRRAATTTTR